MRDPSRIDEIVEVLREAWKKHPDERLGQFIDNCCQGKFVIYRDQYYYSNLRNREDTQWLEAIKRRKLP